MFGFGTGEIIVLAAILVLIFGPKKIPELARSIGDAVRHIRGVSSDIEKVEEVEKEDTSNKTN